MYDFFYYVDCVITMSTYRHKLNHILPYNISHVVFLLNSIRQRCVSDGAEKIKKKVWERKKTSKRRKMNNKINIETRNAVLIEVTTLTKVQNLESSQFFD